MRVAANDTLDLEVANDLGTDIVVAPDPNWQWMSIERVTEVAAATTSAAFSSPSGQFVQVPYDTASINDGSLYDTTAHQLKAAAAGDFQVCASLAFDSATLEGEIDLFLNTTREKSISNGVGIMSGCRSVRVAANDLIDVRVFQNTTSEPIPTDTINADWVDIQKEPISLSVSAISDFMTTSHVYTVVPYSTVAFDDATQYDPMKHIFTAAAGGRLPGLRFAPGAAVDDGRRRRSATSGSLAAA